MAGLPGGFDDGGSDGAPPGGIPGAAGSATAAAASAGGTKAAVPKPIPKAVADVTMAGSEEIVDLDQQIDELKRLEKSASFRRRGSLSHRIEELEEQRFAMLTGDSSAGVLAESAAGGSGSLTTPRGAGAGSSRLRPTLPSFAEEEESDDSPKPGTFSRNKERNASTARSVSSVATPSSVMVQESDLPQHVQKELTDLRRQQRLAGADQRGLARRMDELIQKAAVEMELSMRSPPQELPSFMEATTADADFDRPPSSGGTPPPDSRRGSNRRLDFGGSQRSLSQRSLTSVGEGDGAPVPRLKRTFTGGLERAMSNRSLRALLEQEDGSGSLSARSSKSDRKGKLTGKEVSLAASIAGDAVSKALATYIESPKAKRMSAASGSSTRSLPRSALSQTSRPNSSATNGGGVASSATLPAAARGDKVAVGAGGGAAAAAAQSAEPAAAKSSSAVEAAPARPIPAKAESGGGGNGAPPPVPVKSGGCCVIQ